MRYIVLAAPKNKSSQVMRVGHDPATLTMAVEFKDDTIYHYEGVSVEQFEAFRDADSPGSHLFKVFKSSPEIFPATKQPAAVTELEALLQDSDATADMEYS